MVMRSLGMTALLAAAFGLLGCNASDPERDLAVASEELAEARAGVEASQAVVDGKQRGVDAARSELDASRELLRQAEERLALAESKVDVRATDDVLFRSIQRRLLEDSALEDVAIRAAVAEGIVTLSGDVPDAGLKERAIGIAAATPGVVRVESRIEVDFPPVAAPPAP